MICSADWRKKANGFEHFHPTCHKITTKVTETALDCSFHRPGKDIWQKIPEAAVHTCFYFRLFLLCFTHFGKNVVFVICFTVRLLLALSANEYLCFSGSPRAILQKKQLTLFLLNHYFLNWNMLFAEVDTRVQCPIQKTKWKWNITIAYYSESYPVIISFYIHSYLSISSLSLLHFSYVYNMIMYSICYILQAV